MNKQMGDPLGGRWLRIAVLRSRESACGFDQRALQAGAVAFVQKPPENRELLSAIRQALREEVAMSQFLKT